MAIGDRPFSRLRIALTREPADLLASMTTVALHHSRTAELSCLHVRTQVHGAVSEQRAQDAIKSSQKIVARGISDVTERVAIAHVIEKLQVDGPALRSPHQSAVLGEEGSGLRELRPRRGRSRWRPIYRRLEEALFAILSIGPEAEIDKAGYDRAVREAKQRLARLEKGREKE